MTEFSHVGEHCAFDVCQQLTFLPFRCEDCGKQFCENHRSQDSHRCKKLPLQKQKDMDKLQKAKQESKYDRPHRCAMKGCKKKEIVPIQCSDCGLNFCIQHRMGDDHNCVPVEKTHPLEKNIKKIEKKTIVNVNKPKPQIQSQPSYNDTGAFPNPFANIMSNENSNNNNMSQWQQQQQQMSAFQQFTNTNNNTNISHETQQQETELRDSNYNSQREMQEQLLKQIAENNEKYKWNCNFCTFENVGTATKCTVCDNPKEAKPSEQPSTEILENQQMLENNATAMITDDQNNESKENNDEINKDNNNKNNNENEDNDEEMEDSNPETVREKRQSFLNRVMGNCRNQEKQNESSNDSKTSDSPKKLTT